MISGKTNKVIATVADGDWPQAIAVSPRTGNVYVADQGNGEDGFVHPGGVRVISGKINKVTANVPDAFWPTTIAVSPRNGNVYVGNSLAPGLGIWVISS